MCRQCITWRAETCYRNKVEIVTPGLAASVRFVCPRRRGRGADGVVAVEAARATKFPGHESRGRNTPTPHRLGVATAAATPGAEPQSFAAHSLTSLILLLLTFKGQKI